MNSATTTELIEAARQRMAANQPRAGRENAEHRRVVEAGGAEYVPGTLCGLVMFNSRATGSTLAIEAAQLTAENVRAKLAASDREFGK